MRKSHRSQMVLVGAAVALFAAACSPGAMGSAAGTIAPANAPVDLMVNNENFYDMAVYVVANGVATRIGTVMANRTEDLKIDPSFYEAGNMQIVATPIGAGGRASTGTVVLRPGDTLEFRIAPNLPASTIIVR